MNLGQLIQLFEIANTQYPDSFVMYEFGYFRPDELQSYRGYYEDLAIGYVEEGEITVSQFLSLLHEANGKTFQGYKGGDYIMGLQTRVWIANLGQAPSIAVAGVVLPTEKYDNTYIKTERVGD